MKWETKDKLQKTAIILMIVGFALFIGWSFDRCYSRVVEKSFINGILSISTSVCIKLSSDSCFRSSAGRAADL